MNTRDENAELRRNGRKPKPETSLWKLIIVALLVVVMAYLAYLVYESSQPKEQEIFKTAQPEEFQDEGTSFGVLNSSTPIIEKVTEFVKSPEDAKLQAEILALKDQLKEMVTNNNTDELTKQLSEFQKQMAATEKAREAAALKEKTRVDKLIALEKKRFDDLNKKLEQAKMAAQLKAQTDIEAQLAAQLKAQKEATAMAEREALRKEAVRLRKERIESSMIVLKGSAKEADASQSSLSGSGFRSSVKPTVLTSYSEEIASPESTVVQGTIIRASLETAVDSSLAGLIRAVISTDVHSMDGSRILIPSGSKVLGEYQTEINLAQERINIVWTRIQLSDGRYITLKGFGADRLGRAGVAGQVDTHFAQRFGGAALISIISAIPNIAAASINNKIVSDTAEDVGKDFNSATSEAISEQLSIAPTIYIPQGSDITIIVDRDLVIYDQ